MHNEEVLCLLLGGQIHDFGLAGQVFGQQDSALGLASFGLDWLAIVSFTQVLTEVQEIISTAR